MEDALRVAARLGRRDEQVLGRDVLVLESLGLVLGALQELTRAWVEREGAAGDTCPAADHGGQLHAHLGYVRAEPTKRRRGCALVILEQGGQEMLHVERRALGVRGDALGGQHGLLRLLGVAGQIHGRVAPEASDRGSG